MDNFTQQRKKLRPIDVDCYKNWKLASALLEFQDIAEIDATRLGVGSALFETKNIAWILSQIEFKIYRMPRLHEEIIMSTCHGEWRKFFFYRYYKAVDMQGNVLMDGISNWIILDVNERKMVSPLNYGIDFPLDIHKKPFDISRIRFGDIAFENKRECLPLYSDIDMNSHVNNTKYIEWIMNFIPMDLLANYRPAYINIIYKKEITSDCKVILEWSKKDRTYYVRGKDADTEEMFFECILGFES